MSSIDDWLNEGVAEAVAEVTKPAPPPEPVRAHPPSADLLRPTKPVVYPSRAPAQPTQGAQPLSVRAGPPNRVRNKGGVIRNETTVVRTQVSNPITNPRRPTTQLRGKTVDALPPAEEQMAEFIAQNPGVVVPSLMTGMDVNAVKPKLQAPLQAPQPAVEQPTPAQPVSFDTTLRQLLDLALQNGGGWNIAHSRFVVTIKILNQPAT